MRVEPLEVYEPIGKEGFYILRYSGKIFLCQPTVKDGKKASIAHQCQDADEAVELYERLRDGQV